MTPAFALRRWPTDEAERPWNRPTQRGRLAAGGMGATDGQRRTDARGGSARHGAAQRRGLACRPDGSTWWYWSGDGWTSPIHQHPGLPTAIPTGATMRGDPATGIDWEWKGGPDGGWRPIDPPSSGVHALRHGAREGITKLPAESKSTLMTMRALLEPRRGVMWILFVVIIVIRLALLVANRGGNDPATAPTGLAVRPPLRQDPCSERGGRCSAPASRRRASGSPCRG